MGGFVDGMKHGYGIEVKLDYIKENNQEIETFYEGDFVRGHKHGIGRFNNGRGNYFYGGYQLNRKKGKGY